VGRGSSRSRSRRRSEIKCCFDAVVEDVCLDGGDKGICLEQFPPSGGSQLGRVFSDSMFNLRNLVT